MRSALVVAAIGLACAGPVRADGLIDSVAACTDLQDSSIKIACKYDAMDNGVPVFTFAMNMSSFTEGKGMSYIVARVIQPACRELPIFVALVGINGSDRVTLAAACTPEGGMTEFQVLEES